MHKRILCLILVFVIATGMAACGGEEKRASGTGASGRDSSGMGENRSGSAAEAYFEEEIGARSGMALPGNAAVNSKNQLVVYNGGKGKPEYSILDTDGKPVGKIQCTFEGDGNIFTIGMQDCLYIVNTVITAKPEPVKTQTLYVVGQDGKVLKDIDLGTLSLNSQEDIKKQIAGIAVDAGGNIYLSCTQGAVRMLDPEGNELKTFGNVAFAGMDIDRENNLVIYGLSMADYKYVMEKYNTATGESIWKKSIETVSDGRVSYGDAEKLKCSKTGDSIFILSGDGIDGFDGSGNHTGKVIDFKNYTILASGYMITDMNLDAEDTFYVTSAPNRTFSEDGGSAAESGYEIFKYRLRPVSAEDGEKKVICLSAPDAGRLLDVAVSKFHKANPGYRIEVEESASGLQAGEEYDSYVNSLNTALMSGKGPDILAVGGLPYEKYISRNILADLSEIMVKDGAFDIGAYYSNVLDAMKYKGRLYTMPVSFLINAVFANKKALSERNVTVDDSEWTWNDFKAAGEKVLQAGSGAGDVYVVPPDISHIDMLNVLLQGSYGKFTDIEGKSSNFDSREFIELLNMAKHFGSGDGISVKGSNMGTLKRLLGALFEAASRGTVVFCPGSVNDFIMLSTGKVLLGGELNILKLPGSGAGKRGGSFVCEQVFAINSSSKHKEKAWEFIKILLSEEVQIMDDLFGFPVNKAALRKKAEDVNAMLKAQSFMISVARKGSEVKPVSPEPLTEGEMDLVYKYIEGLSEYAAIDRKVWSIIQAEAERFFFGRKSAEDTAKAIQNKAGIYLGE